jgi:tape measure domain-containing protein
MTTRETTVKLTVADNFSAQLRAFSKALDQSEKSVTQTSKKMSVFGEANAQLASGIKGGINMALASMPMVMVAAGAAALKLGMDMEQTRVAFTSLTGSAELANAHLEELRKFAASTPFQFTELTAASKKMMAFGFAAKDVIPMLTDIGDATSALGAGSAGIDSVVRALGQMTAKGKVSAQEMNQLTEVGINGWKYLAKGMNKTTAEVMALSEKGLIPAGKAVDHLLKGMREDFGGGMAAQSKTAAGQLSNLVDSLVEVGTTIGEIMLPALKAAITKLGEFANTLKEGVRTADLLINWQDKLTEAFIGTEAAIRAGATSYEEYSSATLAVGKAAGLVTDMYIVGQGVVRKYHEDFAMLTEAQFDATQGAYGLSGALDETNRAAMRSAEALTTNSVATADNEATAIKLSDAMRDLTEEFIFQKAAEDMTTEAALALGLSMGTVKAGTVELLTSLDALKVKYDINTDGAIDASEATKGYNNEVMMLRNNIDKLKDKTVTITTLFKEVIEKGSSLPPAQGPKPPGRASGGPVRAGGIYTVGENGPETLIMNRNGGGMVVPTNNYNFNMTVNTQDAASPIREYNLMKAMAGAQ